MREEGREAGRQGEREGWRAVEEGEGKWLLCSSTTDISQYLMKMGLFR